MSLTYEPSSEPLHIHLRVIQETTLYSALVQAQAQTQKERDANPYTLNPKPYTPNPDQFSLDPNPTW